MLLPMQSANTQIADLIQNHAREGFSPSGLVATYRHGALLEHHTWGEDGYSLTSPFRVASLTKSFTGLALLILRRAGQLNLDDPVNLHLPELSVIANPDWPELRLRHLLAMSGGLATDNPWGDRQESVSRGQLSDWAASGLRLLFPPGSSMEYSNLGYALLGEVITRVSDQDYRDFVGQQILDPLGLNSTRFSAAELPAVIAGYHREPPLVGQPDGWSDQAASGPGAFSSIGGLYSTAQDLARWTNLFLSHDVPEGAGFTRADLIEAQEPLGPAYPSMAEFPLTGPAAAGYGFGLVIERYLNHGKVVGHSGGYPGFTANMSWHVRSGLTVIASTNGTHSAATKLARQVLARLIADSSASQADDAPWPETVAAVEAINTLVTDGTLAEGLFADNVEADFPLHRRLDYLRQGLTSLGRQVRKRSNAKHERPSRASWSLHHEFGLLELDIELMPIAPFAVQTFSATMVRAGNRQKLF